MPLYKFRSHVDIGQKCISGFLRHHPPDRPHSAHSTLKLKRAGLSRASCLGHASKPFPIGVKALCRSLGLSAEYVQWDAGQYRHLIQQFQPLDGFAGRRVVGPFRRIEAVLNSVSMVRVDFPPRHPCHTDKGQRKLGCDFFEVISSFYNLSAPFHFRASRWHVIASRS